MASRIWGGFGFRGFWVPGKRLAEGLLRPQWELRWLAGDWNYQVRLNSPLHDQSGTNLQRIG